MGFNSGFKGLNNRIKVILYLFTNFNDAVNVPDFTLSIKRMLYE